MPQIEVGKVEVHLKDPVGKGEDDGADIEETTPSGEKRLRLDPGDHIVQVVGKVQKDGGRAQVPAVGRVWDQVEGAMADGDDQLFVREHQSPNRDQKGLLGHTSSKMSLCSRTRGFMLAKVMRIRIIMDPAM